jgi:FRG domain
MPIQRLKVPSLADYVRLVSRIRSDWTRSAYFDPWFRGVRMASWNLEPGLYRFGLKDEEEDIRSEFERRGTHLITGRAPHDPWEWYFLMQHHRAPTRLLDWSDSALVGLFFAVNSNEPSEPGVTRNAAVWMLDPWWLNQQVLGRSTVVLADWEEARAYLPPTFGGTVRRRLPIAIDPSHVALRISVQRSRFTIHGTDAHGLEVVARRARSRLICIEIAKGSIEKIRKDLVTCGITDSTVFPDLEGLARELSRSAHAEAVGYV